MVIKNLIKYLTGQRTKSTRYMTREETWTKILREEKVKIIDKVDQYIKNGEIEKAIKVLEGFLSRHPYAQDLHNILAELYFQQNKLSLAGRHWYLNENKNDIQLNAIVEFEKYYGKDPLHILKALMKNLHTAYYERNYKLQLLDHYSMIELEKLVDLTIEKHKVIPHFAKDLVEIMNDKKRQPVTQSVHHAGFRAIYKFRARWQGQ